MLTMGLQKLSFISAMRLLKNKNFLDFPHGLLLTLIIISGVCLGWLCHYCFLGENDEKINENKRHIAALNQSIKKRLNFIQLETTHLFSDQTDAIALTSFVKQLSVLSKRNHIEIRTIKPVDTNSDSQKTTILDVLQVDVLGKYPDILNFLLGLRRFSMLTSIETFQITIMDLEKNDIQDHCSHQLHLMAIINLYGSSPQNL